MIQAIIFDLDGTLVQTEKLKARSYALAAVELCPTAIALEDVIEAFKDVVGLPRFAVATALMEQFQLTEAAAAKMAEFGVAEPWQAFVQVRLKHYRALIEDPQVLLDNRWPHTIALLKHVRAANCKVGLATMSHCEQANRVLDTLDLRHYFDFVATRDDVEEGKPNPEIYDLVLRKLGVIPKNCIAIEDSPSGVQAAIKSGAHTLAVTTPFTKSRIHSSGLLPAQYIVDSPKHLFGAVQDIMQTALGR